MRPKFLPVLEKARQHQPKAKWFVFIEADTYLVWQNLLEYLSKFDAHQDLYIEKHMCIGDVLFAHGGSGFALSRAAIQKVTQHVKTHAAEYDNYTARSWAGDMILGKALLDVDVQLFSAFPHFQSDLVSSLDYNVSKIERRPWCYAPITYHHMRGGEMRKLWAFEQAWRKRGKGVLLHRDVFKDYIVPGLATRIDGWDNFSVGSESREVGSVEECYAVCKTQLTCMQYSYINGKCSVSTEIRYGNKADARCIEYSTAASKCVLWQEKDRQGDTIQSGWMIERLPHYMNDMDGLCGEENIEMWIL
ncbi:hypothetical protein GQ44DRAFT_421567 [Phaeosphaeriaceae sp. PMI808]|nr:hypothetical protein GQ44DRAFT_421567 [Phaeosphaeriaceae sp. PMI808]